MLAAWMRGRASPCTADRPRGDRDRGGSRSLCRGCRASSPWTTEMDDPLWRGREFKSCPVPDDSLGSNKTDDFPDMLADQRVQRGHQIRRVQAALNTTNFPTRNGSANCRGVFGGAHEESLEQHLGLKVGEYGAVVIQTCFVGRKCKLNRISDQ